jgi:hypothetical protein
VEALQHQMQVWVLLLLQQVLLPPAYHQAPQHLHWQLLLPLGRL